MYLLYSLVFTLWVVFMTPYFVYNAIRHKKYLPSLKQRLGRLPESLRSDGRRTIWIHACSVGETLSVQPVAKGLRERFPDAKFVFSAITKGGYAIATERFASYGEGNAFYFPIDLAWIARRVFDWIRPTMLVIIDTEIWPNVLREAHRRGISVVMVNGRMSAESFRYYRLARGLMAPVFQSYTALLMKAGDDATRVTYLGAPPDRVSVAGNIKYDRASAEVDVIPAKTRAISKSFGFGGMTYPLIVAGSTHDDEEKTILGVFRRIREDAPAFSDVRLLIAPRHPERFDAVADLIEREGFKLQRRSWDTPPCPETDVFLLDTIGELGAAYQFATVVIVGGTLIPHGGQSIMEPASWGKPIVIGPSMENFTDVKDFRRRDAVVQLKATAADKEAQKAQLKGEIRRLLGDPDLRDRLSHNAFAIFHESQGATARALDKIEEILKGERVPA